MVKTTTIAISVICRKVFKIVGSIKNQCVTIIEKFDKAAKFILNWCAVLKILNLILNTCR